MDDPITTAAYRLLLARVGLSEADVGGSVTFTGADPVVPSRLRYGAATASAIGVQAAAIAAIWRLRSGRGQDVRVDLSRAVNVGLRTLQNMRQNGRAYTVGSLTRANNFFPTRDGRHIYLLRNTGRLSITTDLVGFLKCANDTEEMGAAVAKWNAADLEEALAERRLPSCIARTPDEWLAHPQGSLLAAQPGVEIEKIGDSAPEPFAPAARPMSGIRVLDASHVIAGPATGRMLAEHGADVLHVTTPYEQEHIPVVMDTGFGKRAAYIDLNQVQDVEQLRKLAGQADVFVQSWRPGAMARRGFSPQDLAALRPGIVCVSISCYGSEGPWAQRGGYEPVGQAVSGLSVSEGSIDAPRNAPTVTMNDYLTAYLAASGALGALVRRAREGGSYHVKTSLTQSSMWVLARGVLPDAALLTPPAPYVPSDDHMRTMASPFGELRYAAPIAEFSETSPFWATPPQPAGASLAQWW
ncbi:MAG: acyl-CoA hydratase [Rhizobacter sp.]|nr:acyl-CoA hydratase [Rhizobacter sp.]